MKRFQLLAAALAAAACMAAAAPLAPDTPLIEDKGIRVTALDFEAAMMRVPEEKRIEVRASQERIATMVDVTYVGRQVAAKARAAGLDKDPVVQKRLEQAQEAILTEIYLQHVEKTAKLPNLEQRARELYRADSAKYRTEEHIYLQHILVGLSGRTKEMALERARQLRTELDTGKEDFLAMAKRVSDDPDKRKNGGDLGWFSPRSLEPAMVAAAGSLKKGEVSQPVETQHGYHLVRFIDHKPSEAVPFEAVKQGIMANERQRLLKEGRDGVLKEIRDSTTVIVHRANLEALRVDIDMSKAARAPASGAAPK